MQALNPAHANLGYVGCQHQLLLVARVLVVVAVAAQGCGLLLVLLLLQQQLGPSAALSASSEPTQQL